MTEERERLDRVVRGFAPPDDAFERLANRRGRKQRNRRLRAGAVGVIVALATTALLVRASESDHVPAHPGPSKPLGAGEVLYGGSARNPDTGDVRRVVDTEALPLGARSITATAWSYDRKWVAFRASPGGSSGGSIWVADTVSGAPRRVATDGRWSPWVWSPTEDQLAAVQGRHVILIEVTTGRETDLGTTAKGTEADGVQAMVWSPDGTQIAYSGGPRGGSVYSIDVESGEQAVLVPQPAGAGTVIDIDWSPDGAHLAITYEDTSQRLRGDFRKALYLAKADGSATHLVDGNVAAGYWPDWHPGMSVGTAWSPDGTRLAYTTRSGPGGHSELQVWTVSANGSDPSLVTSHCCVSDGGGPVWSPDGAQIAFATEGEGGVQLGGVVRDHLVVNADGTGDEQQIDQFMYQSWAGGWFFCFCYG